MPTFVWCLTFPKKLYGLNNLPLTFSFKIILEDIERKTVKSAVIEL